MEKQFSLVLDIIECQNTLILLLSLKQSHVRKMGDNLTMMPEIHMSQGRQTNQTPAMQCFKTGFFFVPCHYVFHFLLDLGLKSSISDFTLRETSPFVLLFLEFFFVYI